MRIGIAVAVTAAFFGFAGASPNEADVPASNGASEKLPTCRDAQVRDRIGALQSDAELLRLQIQKGQAQHTREIERHGALFETMAAANTPEERAQALKLLDETVGKIAAIDKAIAANLAALDGLNAQLAKLRSLPPCA